MANITLSYAKKLKEVFGNNGAIANSITIEATNGTFSGNNGDAVGTVTGVPAGLTAVLVKTSGTTAKLSFTGAATAHNAAAEAVANGTATADNTQAIAKATTINADTGVAQVDTITLSGKYEAGDIVTVGGVATDDVTYTVLAEDIVGANDAATAEAVAAKLITAINGATGVKVTAAAFDGSTVDGKLTLTAKVVDTDGAFTTIVAAANPAAAGGLKITFTDADFLTGTTGGSLVVSDIDFDFTDPYTDGTLSIAPPVAAIGKDALAELTGTAAAGTKVAVFNGTKLVGETTANGSGTWSLASPTAKAGVYNFTVREVLDATAKLYGPSSPSVQYTWDSKPPTAPTVTAIKGATSNTMPVLSGKTEKGATVEVFAKGGNFAEATSLGKAVADAKTGAWVLLPNKVLDKDGAYEITAKATDAAGNTADSKKAVTLTIDTEVAKNTITVGDIAKGAVRLTGEAEAGATVQLYGGADGSVALGKVIKADKNGAWKTSIKPGDGKHLITAVVTDAAGNSSVSEVAEAVVDTFAFALIDKVEGGKLKGTSDPEAEIAILAGKTKLTTKAGADGKWEVALTDLKGSVKFSATATDKTGNKSKTFVKTLDVVAAGGDGTFTVTNNAGVLAFDGSVTGDITVTESGGNLTFARGGVTATNTATLADLKADTGIPAPGTDKLVMTDEVYTAIADKLAPAAAVKLSDTSLDLAKLKTIEAGQTGLVDATAVTTTSGTVADAKLLLVTKEGTTGDKIDMAAAVAVTLTDPGSTADTDAILNATTGAVTTALLTAGTYANFASGDKIDTGLTFAASTSQPLADDGDLHWNFDAGVLTIETVDTAAASDQVTVVLTLTGVTAVAEVGGVFTLTV